MNRDEYWMEQALAMAKKAALSGEVPVGAVIVKEDKLVTCSYNEPIRRNDPSAHAEILALRAAGTVLGNYRLKDVTMYVTLEPCLMCVGALVHARVGRLVYGAGDPKRGAVDYMADSRLNHKIEVTGGVMSEMCGNILKTFFQKKREMGEKNDNKH